MRRVSSEKTQATHGPAITISDDGSLVRKRMFSGLFTSHALDLNISPNIGKGNDRGKGNILEIPVDDAVVVQVLHAGQDGTGEKTKRISLSLLSPVEVQSNVSKHGYGISFRGMAALTEGVVQVHPRTNREGHGDSHHFEESHTSVGAGNGFFTAAIFFNREFGLSMMEILHTRSRCLSA